MRSAIKHLKIKHFQLETFKFRETRFQFCGEHDRAEASVGHMALGFNLDVLLPTKELPSVAQAVTMH